MLLEGDGPGQPFVGVLLHSDGAFARTLEPVVIGTDGKSDFRVSGAIEPQRVAALPCRVAELHREWLRASSTAPLEYDRPRSSPA